MVKEQVFGVTEQGETVHSYCIKNNRGVSVTVLDYGCTLQSVRIPLNGKDVDICLGYDTIREYEQNDGYLGAVIGRYAGRIPDSVLFLNGQSYPLYRNDGVNHLHGGRIGFNKRVFQAEAKDSSVMFRYVSPDGEEGYPASLSVSVTYLLTDDNVLRIVFRGVSDGMTVWNPTNHAYWNLNGHQSGSVLSHELKIPADCYVPVDRTLIPIDHAHGVSGTPYDFRNTKPILKGFQDPEIKDANGYDTSFILSNGFIELSGNIGIQMRINTDCKAIQLYTANNLSERIGKDGAFYKPHDAICIETESRQMLRGCQIPEESILNPNAVKEHMTEFMFLY